MDLPHTQSLKITFWGIIELIIKESCDEGSDALVSIIPLSCFSLVSSSRMFFLAYSCLVLPTEYWKTSWRRQLMNHKIDWYNKRRKSPIKVN